MSATENMITDKEFYKRSTEIWLRKKMRDVISEIAIRTVNDWLSECDERTKVKYKREVGYSLNLLKQVADYHVSILTLDPLYEKVVEKLQLDVKAIKKLNKDMDTFGETSTEINKYTTCAIDVRPKVRKFWIKALRNRIEVFEEEEDRHFVTVSILPRLYSYVELLATLGDYKNAIKIARTYFHDLEENEDKYSEDFGADRMYFVYRVTLDLIVYCENVKDYYEELRSDMQIYDERVAEEQEDDYDDEEDWEDEEYFYEDEEEENPPVEWIMRANVDPMYRPGRKFRFLMDF